MGLYNLSMKLIIVANRLPFSLSKDGHGIKLKKSPGGLVSGLETFLKKYDVEFLWFGWPGASLNKKETKELERIIEDKKLSCVPVYVPDRLMDRFYNGFCNKTLWPLFHNLAPLAVYSQEFWHSYVEVNRLFLNTILSSVDWKDERDILVWIHDYHLMLLPGMLREALPNISIGFFLHIPFPPPETFSQLPWRREVLEGLLGADLVGFHTYEYTNNFIRSVSKLLGIEPIMGSFIYNGRVVKADTFPMGIDFELFNSYANRVEDRVREIKRHLEGKRIIFSVDRLDYTKGIYNRLLAYEKFLSRNEGWHGKVVLILNMVPSREKVEQYQSMKRQIEQKVAEINGRFGSVDWVPILYHYRSLDWDELVAHYLACDVILVTPIKDGMNLIAKEFVASRSDLRGVLILSEFAGSAKELGEAVLVNPNSIEDLARAIELALEMPPEEQESRLKIMQERLRRYNILKWGVEFIEALKEATRERDKLKARELNEKLMRRIVEMFKSASKRVIFIDYDGTLVPLVKRPSLAVPSQEVKDLLKRLALKENTQVVLISGRRKEELEAWFSDLPINMIAEHGCWIKYAGKDWEARATMPSDIKDKIRNVMEIYVDRLPQAFVEEKSFTIAFHYRNADPEMAIGRVAELVEELHMLVANTDLNVLLGNKVVEVRPAGINKGTASLSFCQDCDFLMAIGDDVTDEDLFRALPERAITIKVGPAPTFAKYTIKSYKETINLLKQLLEE